MGNTSLIFSSSQNIGPFPGISNNTNLTTGFSVSILSAENQSTDTAFNFFIQLNEASRKVELPKPAEKRPVYVQTEKGFMLVGYINNKGLSNTKRPVPRGTGSIGFGVSHRLDNIPINPNNPFDFSVFTTNLIAAGAVGFGPGQDTTGAVRLLTEHSIFSGSGSGTIDINPGVEVQVAPNDVKLVPVIPFTISSLKRGGNQELDRRGNPIPINDRRPIYTQPFIRNSFAAGPEGAVRSVAVSAIPTTILKTNPDNPNPEFVDKIPQEHLRANPLVLRKVVNPKPQQSPEQRKMQVAFVESVMANVVNGAPTPELLEQIQDPSTRLFLAERTQLLKLYPALASAVNQINQERPGESGLTRISKSFVPAPPVAANDPIAKFRLSLLNNIFDNGELHNNFESQIKNSPEIRNSIKQHASDLMTAYPKLQNAIEAAENPSLFAFKQSIIGNIFLDNAGNKVLSGNLQEAIKDSRIRNDIKQYLPELIQQTPALKRAIEAAEQQPSTPGTGAGTVTAQQPDTPEQPSSAAATVPSDTATTATQTTAQAEKTPFEKSIEDNILSRQGADGTTEKYLSGPLQAKIQKDPTFRRQLEQFAGQVVAANPVLQQAIAAADSAANKPATAAQPKVVTQAAAPQPSNTADTSSNRIPPGEIANFIKSNILRDGNGWKITPELLNRIQDPVFRQDVREHAPELIRSPSSFFGGVFNSVENSSARTEPSQATAQVDTRSQQIQAYRQYIERNILNGGQALSSELSNKIATDANTRRAIREFAPDLVKQYSVLNTALQIAEKPTAAPTTQPRSNAPILGSSAGLTQWNAFIGANIGQRGEVLPPLKQAINNNALLRSYLMDQTFTNKFPQIRQLVTLANSTDSIRNTPVSANSIPPISKDIDIADWRAFLAVTITREGQALPALQKAIQENTLLGHFLKTEGYTKEFPAVANLVQQAETRR